jgi:hypothetical protein
LKEAAEALFIDQSSLLNRTVVEVKADSSEINIWSKPLSVTSVDNESFVSAQETIADLREFDEFEGTLQNSWQF